MKIELIQIKDEFGDTYWQTEVDGEYSVGSISHDLEGAITKFNALKRSKGETKKEVIKSITI